MRLKGGTILGRGRDGCVTDSIACDDLPGYVAKVFNPTAKVNKTIQNELAVLDPDEKRFIRYHTCSKRSKRVGTRECSRRRKRVVFMKPLTPLDRLTKPQYRYLRESLELLHRSGVGHGDLPNNVMLGDDGLPRIIDWETADHDDTTIKIDGLALLTHFKAVKSPRRKRSSRSSRSSDIQIL